MSSKTSIDESFVLKLLKALGDKQGLPPANYASARENFIKLNNKAEELLKKHNDQGNKDELSKTKEIPETGDISPPDSVTNNNDAMAIWEFLDVAGSLKLKLAPVAKAEFIKVMNCIEQLEELNKKKQGEPSKATDEAGQKKGTDTGKKKDTVDVGNRKDLTCVYDSGTKSVSGKSGKPTEGPNFSKTVGGLPKPVDESNNSTNKNITKLNITKEETAKADEVVKENKELKQKKETAKTDEALKENKELKQKIKDLEKANTELKEKMDLSQTRNQNVEKENQEVKKENNTLKEKERSMERRIGESEKQLNSTKEEWGKTLKELQIQKHNYTDLRSRLEHEQALNAEIENESRRYREQVEELTSRLSSFASKQLTENNPNVADLSDKNRPTKIGEKFGSLYDDEWSEAFDALTSEDADNEETVIKDLMDIIQESYSFCRKLAGRQLEFLSNSMKTSMTDLTYATEEKEVVTVQTSTENPKFDSTRMKYAKDYRKAVAESSVLGVCKIFKDIKLAKFPEESRNKMSAYADKCTELIWYMVVQEPPMIFEIPKPDSQFNASGFKHYKKKGKIVKLPVWPAVKLHEGGGLISKGYVLPK